MTWGDVGNSPRTMNSKPKPVERCPNDHPAWSLYHKKLRTGETIICCRECEKDMPTILPKLGSEDPNGKEITMQEILGQAIGAASTCWKEDGVFDEQTAGQLVDELMAATEQYAAAKRDEGLDDGSEG